MHLSPIGGCSVLHFEQVTVRRASQFWQ